MRYIIFLSVLFFVAACGGTSVNAEDQALIGKEAALLEDINRIHDVETMPKLGYMENLKKDLDALEGVEDSIVFSRKKDLDDAYDAMMGWMAQFNWQSKLTPIKNRVEYYGDEVIKLEEMKTIMYSAIDSAEVTLGK